MVACSSLSLSAATPSPDAAAAAAAEGRLHLIMVSLRRRKLLGHCSVEHPGSTENYNAVGNPDLNTKSFSVPPVPSIDHSHKKVVEMDMTEVTYGPLDVTASRKSKEESSQYYPGKEIKHRKRHRRKHEETRETCIMRGVYFKNMKWQAAIKVDKRQIHLGTVGSQEEAARLYDRAAYMCGREPNFELTDEAKQELSKYKWEEFLEVTRNAINNKKRQRRLRDRLRKPEIQSLSSDWEQEIGMDASSLSDNEDVDTSVL